MLMTLSLPCFGAALVISTKEWSSLHPLHFPVAVPQKAILGSSVYSEITLFCMSIKQPSDGNNSVICSRF